MHKHIAAFGEVMMRLQVPGNELLSQSNQLTYSFSGTGVNVTAMLAQLGHIGSMVTTLPNNSLGEAAISYLRKLGIKDNFIQRKGKYLGMYFLENGFSIRPTQVTYSNRMESSFNTTNKNEYNFHEIAKQINMVHFCGISLAMNETIRHQMKSFATFVKNHEGLVVFDCNYRPSLWGKNGHTKARPHYEEMLHAADIVIMNEQDAIHTLGMTTNQDKRINQLEELIPKVAHKYNISVIAGTHRTINENNTHSIIGYQFKHETFIFSKPITFTVLDRIGAGDAFTAGLIHGMCANFPEQKTVDFATAASGLAHTIVGDSPILSEENIIEVMSNNSADVRR